MIFIDDAVTTHEQVKKTAEKHFRRNAASMKKHYDKNNQELCNFLCR